jgi:hypothetical protein
VTGEALAPREFHDRLQQLMQARGWRDTDGGAAQSLLIAASVAERRDLSNIDVQAVVPEEFFIRNDVSAFEVSSALRDFMGTRPVGNDATGFELITIDRIDSFAAVREIDPSQVAGFARWLDINERVVKHCIHKVLGDPNIDQDWGGERADIVTDRVQVDAVRTLTAFLLKGRSVRGPLYGSELGRRGDQIVRLMEVRARLSVIQHVGEIPSETQDQLRFAVTALRVAGVTDAHGSVWDGVDTARLLRAYGYLDPDGNLTAQGEAANEQRL